MLSPLPLLLRPSDHMVDLSLLLRDGSFPSQFERTDVLPCLVPVALARLLSTDNFPLHFPASTAQLSHDAGLQPLESDSHRGVRQMQTVNHVKKKVQRLRQGQGFEVWLLD